MIQTPLMRNNLSSLLPLTKQNVHISNSVKKAASYTKKNAAKGNREKAYGEPD